MLYGMLVLSFCVVYLYVDACAHFISNTRAYNKPLQWMELIALVTVLRTLGGSGRCPIENHNGRVRARGWVWISISITLKLGRRFDLI